MQKTRRGLCVRVCLMEVLAEMGVGEQSAAGWICQAGKSRFTLVDSTHLSRQSARCTALPLRRAYIYTHRGVCVFHYRLPASARTCGGACDVTLFRRRKCARGGLRWFSGATSADRAQHPPGGGGGGPTPHGRQEFRLREIIIVREALFANILLTSSVLAYNNLRPFYAQPSGSFLELTNHRESCFYMWCVRPSALVLSVWK